MTNEKKLRILEMNLKFQIDENRKVNRRLDKLESHFSGDYQLVATKLTPHKCPVCEGCGRVLTEAAKIDFDGMLRADLPTSKDCKSCEGKGIVWG